MRSQSHERSWPPLFKLKFGNGWLISKCCGSHCKKSIPVFNSNSNSNSRVFNSNSIFNSTNFNSNSNSNSGIGIGIDQQFQFRNWIDPNPAHSPYIAWKTIGRIDLILDTHSRQNVTEILEVQYLQVGLHNHDNEVVWCTNKRIWPPVMMSLIICIHNKTAL